MAPQRIDEMRLCLIFHLYNVTAVTEKMAVPVFENRRVGSEFAGLGFRQCTFSEKRQKEFIS